MVGLKQILKEHKIKLEFLEMESEGCYIASIRTMFVNQCLSEDEMKRVILHELKHGLDHTEYVALYRSATHRSKMEAEADIYVLDQYIKEHDGHYNFSGIIEEFEIGMGYENRYARYANYYAR